MYDLDLVFIMILCC